MPSGAAAVPARHGVPDQGDGRLPDVQEDVVPAQPARKELHGARVPRAALPRAQGAAAEAGGAAGGPAAQGVPKHGGPWVGSIQQGLWGYQSTVAVARWRGQNEHGPLRATELRLAGLGCACCAEFRRRGRCFSGSCAWALEKRSLGPWVAPTLARVPLRLLGFPVRAASHAKLLPLAVARADGSGAKGAVINGGGGGGGSSSEIKTAPFFRHRLRRGIAGEGRLLFVHTREF